MKKTIASTAFIIVFAFYALYQHAVAQTDIIATAPASSTVPASVTASVAATTAAAPPKKSTVAVATTQGQYRDGTYTGTPADAYYGNVRVRVTITNGKIASVTFLDYPQDRGTSRSINSFAMPQLTQEAIAVQNANVNGVSGASDTSMAFRQSLSSALAQAA